MAGDLIPRHLLTASDNPAVTSGGGVTPTRYNLGVKLTGGSDGLIVVKLAAGDAGVDLTARPAAQTIVFPLSAPSSPANGSFWVEESGGSVLIRVKKSDGTIVSLEIG
jgi:hypothetical protein